METVVLLLAVCSRLTPPGVLHFRVELWLAFKVFALVFFMYYCFPIHGYSWYRSDRNNGTFRVAVIAYDAVQASQQVAVCFAPMHRNHCRPQGRIWKQENPIRNALSGYWSVWIGFVARNWTLGLEKPGYDQIKYEQ